MKREELILKLIEVDVLFYDFNGQLTRNSAISSLSDNLILLNQLIAHTNFLHEKDVEHKHSFRLRVESLAKGFIENPKCKSCDQKVRFQFDGKYRNTWREFCSYKCSSGHIDTLLKAQKTCFENRGTTHHAHCPKVQMKTIATNLERYGKARPSQIKMFKDKAKQTSQSKYGVNHPQQCQKIREKGKQTCLIRYGNEHALASKHVKDKSIATNLRVRGKKFAAECPKVRKKIEDTNERRYGEKYFLYTKEGRAKANQIIKERYKVQNVSQSPLIKQKKIDTNMEKRGVENPSQCPFVRRTIIKNNNEKFDRDYEKQIHISKSAMSKLKNPIWLKEQHINQELSLVEIAQELGVDNSTVRNYMLKHNLDIVRHARSVSEKDIATFLKEHNITNIETNTRSIISPLELDIYLPDYKVAIEYCGLYWHTDAHDRIDKNYHLNKLKQCENQSIRLLTIFEDEWEDRQQQVKNKILSTIGLLNQETAFARKCNVKNISISKRKEFLNNYHIQGDGRGSVTYGLENKGTIVAVMTLFKRDQKGTWELNRYATSCNVPGGFSKLLKHFQNNNPWKKIISFADLRISSGDMYEKSGWTLDGRLYPDYDYIYKGDRVNKRQFRHKNLHNMLENYNPNLSETENTENNNIFKIWNCGLNRYILENTIE